jgi:hypothetical protein
MTHVPPLDPRASLIESFPAARWHDLGLPALRDLARLYAGRLARRRRHRRRHACRDQGRRCNAVVLIGEPSRAGVWSVSRRHRQFSGRTTGAREAQSAYSCARQYTCEIVSIYMR